MLYNSSTNTTHLFNNACKIKGKINSLISGSKARSKNTGSPSTGFSNRLDTAWDDTHNPFLSFLYWSGLSISVFLLYFGLTLFTSPPLPPSLSRHHTQEVREFSWQGRARERTRQESRSTWRWATTSDSCSDLCQPPSGGWEGSGPGGAAAPSFPPSFTDTGSIVDGGNTGADCKAPHKEDPFSSSGGKTTTTWLMGL